MKAAVLLVLATSVAAAAPARRGTCEMRGQGWCNGPATQICQLEEQVPLGCPIHVVVRRGDYFDVLVHRSDRVLRLPITSTVVNVTHDVDTMIDQSCSIGRKLEPTGFFQFTMTLSGARVGDELVIPDGRITIVSPGACRPPVWPTTFIASILPCDLVPCPPVPPPPLVIALLITLLP